MLIYVDKEDEVKVEKKEHMEKLVWKIENLNAVYARILWTSLAFTPNGNKIPLKNYKPQKLSNTEQKIYV